MKIIGLSGGIASGKSTISKVLKEMNIPVIDGDEIVHEIMESGSSIVLRLVNEFGKDILNRDGTINRKKLGTLVFKDKRKLEKLNNITHPIIKDEIINRIEALKKANEKYCVVDGALLMEGIFKNITNILILVYVSPDIQIKRLMERNSINYEEALNKINSQIPFEEKKKYADYVIDNSKDVEYTINQLNKIMNEILKMEDVND